MMVKPSSDRSCAHCTVSIFNAAFEILYAGVGACLKAGARPIDPNVVALADVVSMFSTRRTSMRVSDRDDFGRMTYMLTTFFSWLFFSKGRNAAVTLWTASTFT